MLKKRRGVAPGHQRARRAASLVVTGCVSAALCVPLTAGLSTLAHSAEPGARKADAGKTGTARSAGVTVARPDIVTRAVWGGRKADVSLMRAQKPREIVVHHTSYKGRPKLSLERKMRGLESFSRRGGKVGTRAKPAWGDIPYHFYIGAMGRIGEGRDPAYAGDTNTPYDVNGRIQVVVEGHFDQEQPRPAQLTALRQLLAWLTAKYAIAPSGISAHNDHVSTNCPGKNLKSLLPGISASLPR